MANILEFLRGVLTDVESQRLFRADPEGYVARSGFADLTGEDVVEAIAVLRRSLPPDIASALGDFDDERALPAIRPAFDERELDAALRQLHHAVDLVSGAEAPTAAAAPAPTPPSSLFSPVHDEPIPVEIEPELTAPEPASAQPTPSPLPEHEPVHHHEPIAVEASPSFTEPAPTYSSPAPSHVASSVERPGGADLRARLEALTDDLVDHLAAIIDDAERYADEVRTEADRDAQGLRSQADADREEARRILLDARDEADRIRADAAAGNAELESRRAALREAERELKDRLAGLDSVFRSVLKDE